MFLQSVPSPSGYTRRKRRNVATAVVSCLFFIEGLCGEVASTTRPRLEHEIGLVEARVGSSQEIAIGNDGLQRKASESEWTSEERTRLMELVARQVVATGTSSSPSTSTSTTTTTTTTPLQESTIPPPGGATTISPASSSVNPSSTSSSPISTSTAVPQGYELPRPFDSTLGTNFTSTACPSFFATFLADPEFISCAPFSLLLGTSSGFFQAQRSPDSLLPYVLDSSCSAPTSTCSALMDKYARQIKLQNTCGQDLSKGNPLAQEALEGFQNYRMYREVGCQKSNETVAKYCFADASANSDPDSLYFYYLAEGTSLPSGTVASCDYCLQNLLGTYSRYAINSTLPISKTYSSGRSVAALACGPNFAPIVSKTVSAAHSRFSTSMILPSSFGILVLSAWLTLY
ncbi:hypothetical protein JCM16303_002090 [Sporobolomyces ruberrimus]